jgi:hypothetical protein
VLSSALTRSSGISIEQSRFSRNVRMTGETGEASLHVRHGRGMARIYRVDLLLRVLGTIFCLAVSVGLVAMVGLVLLNNEGPLPVSKVAGVTVLGILAVVFLWLLVLQLSYRITLTDDAIASSLCGWERVLRRADIAGFREVRRRGQRSLTIVPIDPRLKPLRLGPNLATDALFEAWIAALPDLNAEDFKASEARILGDRSYGATPQARLARLAAARTLAKLLNAVALGVAAWCLLAPWPYLAAIGAAAVLPFLTLIMVAVSGGLVRFMRSTTEAHAGATVAPVYCAAVLVWHAYWDVHLIDLSVAVKVGGVIGLILLALAVIADRSLIWLPGIAAVIAVAYGIAVVTLANVQLDRSLGAEFQSRVVDSHVSRDKNRTYLVKLAPWGPWQSTTEVSVPEALFIRLMPGSFACIRMYDGAFGIRWFSVDACALSGSHPAGTLMRFAPGTAPIGPPPPVR